MSGVEHSLTPETIKINHSSRQNQLQMKCVLCLANIAAGCQGNDVLFLMDSPGTKVWEWWCPVSERELQLQMKLHHHLVDTLGMDPGSSVFCYEQNDNTSLKKISLKCKVLNPILQASGFFSTHGHKWQLRISFGKSVYFILWQL